MNSSTKYDSCADGFSEKEYANPERYNLRKVSIAVSKGRHHLKAGDTVLDLGCGDGITSYFFAKTYHLRVIGIDYSVEMVKSAKKRCMNCNPCPVFMHGDINLLDKLALPEDGSIKCATLFRSSYYISDWAGFAEDISKRCKKIVIDINPRTQDLELIKRAFRQTSLNKIITRPFFTSMKHSLPWIGYRMLEIFENVPIISNVLLKYRFFITFIAEA